MFCLFISHPPYRHRRRRRRFFFPSTVHRLWDCRDDFGHYFLFGRCSYFVFGSRKGKVSPFCSLTWLFSALSFPFLSCTTQHSRKTTLSRDVPCPCGLSASPWQPKVSIRMPYWEMLICPTSIPFMMEP